MTKQRRVFSSEFKSDAVRRCNEAGRTLTQWPANSTSIPGFYRGGDDEASPPASSARTPDVSSSVDEGSPSTAA